MKKLENNGNPKNPITSKQSKNRIDESKNPKFFKVSKVDGPGGEGRGRAAEEEGRKRKLSLDVQPDHQGIRMDSKGNRLDLIRNDWL